MSSSIQFLIDEFIQLMRSESMPITRVYVFGKHAKGRFNEGDMISTAVVFEEWEDFDEIKRKLLRLRRNIDSRISPYPFLEEEFVSGESFASEIMETGVQIL